MARDSRSETRKAWWQMRKAWWQIRIYLPLRDREHFKRAILLILTDLARREYEAGYIKGQRVEREHLARRRG